jgi:hypothetical protein
MFHDAGLGPGPAITHFQNDGTLDSDLLIDFIPTIIAGLPAWPGIWTLTPDWPERALPSAQHERHLPLREAQF